MKSMMLDASEQKEAAVEMAPSRPSYPYGLRLELNQDTLEKLGIPLPQVGEKLTICAIGSVESCHASEQEGGKKYASCSVQITEMEVENESAMDSIAQRLYKKEA